MVRPASASRCIRSDTRASGTKWYWMFWRVVSVALAAAELVGDFAPSAPSARAVSMPLGIFAAHHLHARLPLAVDAVRKRNGRNSSSVTVPARTPAALARNRSISSRTVLSCCSSKPSRITKLSSTAADMITGAISRYSIEIIQIHDAMQVSDMLFVYLLLARRRKYSATASAYPGGGGWEAPLRTLPVVWSLSARRRNFSSISSTPVMRLSTI